MRVLTGAILAGLLLMPAGGRAGDGANRPVSIRSATPPTIELSAATKKQDKVEYMRSAAGPEPAAPKAITKNMKKKKK